METVGYSQVIDAPVVPAEQPVVGIQPEVNEWDEVAKDAKPIKAIDLIRPDYVLARGRAAQHERRTMQTIWRPTPRNNILAHQGVRECARRRRQTLH